MGIFKSIITILATLCLSCLVTPQAAAQTSPRVISLYAAHTEVLLRLGAKDNIIGVSAQETYKGPENWNPPVFSIRDDVEKFIAAKPDIILVRPMHLAAGSRLVGTLEAAGIKIHAAQVLRAADLYTYWRGLAALVGREAEAEKMIADFDSKIAAYHQAASARPEAEKPGVFIESIHDQVKTFTPDSLPVWLIELAGAKNIADDAHAASPGLIIANYGPERLLAKADEVDIFITQVGTMNPAHPTEADTTRNIYQPLPAFQNGRHHTVPESLLTRPTPSLLEGLEMIADWTGLTIEKSKAP